jgi:DNA-binding NtrC family response regulator
MPAQAQVRLLRVLETGRFSRVGASTQQQVDVRIVAATNKDLAEAVQKGTFRKDLYYRLSTVLIDIPPLRDRAEDILPIFETFLYEYAQEYSSTRKRLTDAAEELLQSYRWPGNVRELRNIAERVSVLMRDETVDVDDLRPLLRDLGQAAPSTELMRVEPPAQDASSPDGEGRTEAPRHRELLYRAILEMRMDMRDLKEQLGSLISNVGVVVPREVAERGDFPSDYDDFVVVNSDAPPEPPAPHDRDQPGGGEVDSMMRDVVYEVGEGEPARPTRRRSGRPSSPDSPKPSARPSPEPPDPVSTDDELEPLPTLEEAEKQLIRQALHEFDGNRRKTAEALGISERTLYRKLKNIDEDL